MKGLRLYHDMDKPLEEFEWETLEDLQKEVGGLVERVRYGRPLDRIAFADSIMLVNEEGLLKNLPINARASWLYGTAIHGGYIRGDAIVVGEGWVEAGEDSGIDFIELSETVKEEVMSELYDHIERNPR